MMATATNDPLLLLASIIRAPTYLFEQDRRIAGSQDRKIAGSQDRADY